MRSGGFVKDLLAGGAVKHPSYPSQAAFPLLLGLLPTIGLRRWCDHSCTQRNIKGDPYQHTRTVSYNHVIFTFDVSFKNLPPKFYSNERGVGGRTQFTSTKGVRRSCTQRNMKKGIF